jgi:hypothetical protein
MAISSTTFTQRIDRISKHQNGRQAVESFSSPRNQGTSPRRARLNTPFYVGVGILTCGTAYAWLATRGAPQWAERVIEWAFG